MHFFLLQVRRNYYHNVIIEVVKKDCFWFVIMEFLTMTKCATSSVEIANGFPYLKAPKKAPIEIGFLQIVYLILHLVVSTVMAISPITKI